MSTLAQLDDHEHEDDCAGPCFNADCRHCLCDHTGHPYSDEGCAQHGCGCPRHYVNGECVTCDATGLIGATDWRGVEYEVTCDVCSGSGVVYDHSATP